MLCFFFKSIFFQHHPDSSPIVSIAHLPSFDPLRPSDPLPSPQRFKPNLVYEQRRKRDAAAPPPPQKPPDLAPDIDPSLPLHCSICISQPPDRYGFSHTSLLDTLSSIAISNSYSQAVKHKCRRQAIKKELDALEDNHTWEVAYVHRQLSQLDVNGYSLSNSSPTAHWIEIMHVSLLLANDRSMASTMMVHLLQ